MIIGVMNQKGGVGKTTIAVNLAHALSTKKAPARLIDTDPQGSATRWWELAETKFCDFIAHPRPIHTDIEALTRDWQYTVIDTPPGAPGESEIVKSCLLVVDMAIIPVTPSPLDLWASDDLVEMVAMAKRHNPRLDARVLVSKKVANTTVGREAKQAIGYYGLATFKTEISHRIAYVNAAISGETILTYAPFSDAAKDIVKLKNEIVRKVTYGKKNK